MMERANRVDPLNVMRVIACLLVFGIHCTLFEDASFLDGGWTFLLRTPGWAGVWIFFCLGGYLMGRAFAERRYVVTLKGVCEFYWRRITKALIPTYLFIILNLFLLAPNYFSDNPEELKRFLTFRSISYETVGATWYVFVVLWLWIATPFVAAVCNIVKKYKVQKYIFVVAYVMLVIFGYKYRNYVFISGQEWYDGAYANPIANIDLYFGGFVFAYLLSSLETKHLNCSKYKNIISTSILIGFLSLIIYNSYVFDSSALRDINYHYLIIYQYRIATAYLIVCCVVFWAVYDVSMKYTKPDLENIKLNPLRCIDWFSGISFEFYLFHSLVLLKVKDLVPFENGSLAHHFALVVIAFIITIFFSVGFKKLMKNN